MPKEGQRPAREGYLKPGAKNVEAAVNRLANPKAMFKQAVQEAKKSAKTRLGY